jgi:hypothetical protein
VAFQTPEPTLVLAGAVYLAAAERALPLAGTQQPRGLMGKHMAAVALEAKVRWLGMVPLALWWWNIKNPGLTEQTGASRFTRQIMGLGYTDGIRITFAASKPKTILRPHYSLMPTPNPQQRLALIWAANNRVLHAGRSTIHACDHARSISLKERRFR